MRNSIAYTYCTWCQKKNNYSKEVWEQGWTSIVEFATNVHTTMTLEYSAFNGIFTMWTIYLFFFYSVKPRLKQQKNTQIN